MKSKLFIFLIASIFLIGVVAATTTITDKFIDLDGGKIIDVETIELEGKSLTINDTTKEVPIVIFNSNFAGSMALAQGFSAAEFAVPNATTTFMGDVNNIDNVDSFSRFGEHNINDGTSSGAGFTGFNDIENNISMIIGSSNFEVGGVNLNNHGLLQLSSPGEMNFVNTFLSGWRWFANQANSSTTSNLLEVMSLGPGGNLNIAGNFTGNQFYGEMFIADNANPISIGVVGAFTRVEDYVAGETNGFTFDGVGDHLEDEVNGLYKADYSISFIDANNRQYLSSLAINDLNQSKCQSGRKIAASNDRGNMGSSCLLRLVGGDKVTVIIANLDSTDNPTIEDSNLNLVRIGA